MKIYPSLRRKFYSLFVPSGPDDCWEWIGWLTPQGYGLLKGRGATYRAHRVAYQIAHGKAPIGEVCHTCDNPACVNPNHLFDGSRTDNVNDAISKGRWPEGEQANGAKLSTVQVLAIRRLYRSGTKIAELARQFKTPYSTIWNIVHNQKRVRG